MRLHGFVVVTLPTYKGNVLKGLRYNTMAVGMVLKQRYCVQETLFSLVCRVNSGVVLITAWFGRLLWCLVLIVAVLGDDQSMEYLVQFAECLRCFVPGLFGFAVAQ